MIKILMLLQDLLAAHLHGHHIPRLLAPSHRLQSLRRGNPNLSDLRFSVLLNLRSLPPLWYERFHLILDTKTFRHLQYL